MTETAKAKRAVLTPTIVIRAANLIKEHMQHAEGHLGFYKYADGWSDEVIAKEIDPDTLNAKHIARIRVDLGYKLPPYRPFRMRIAEKHNELVDWMIRNFGGEGSSAGQSLAELKIDIRQPQQEESKEE